MFMKVLLIAPPHHNIVSPSYMQTIQEGVGHLPPLGVLSVASYAREKTRHQVKVIDAPLENLTSSQLAAEAAREKPDVVGIYTITLNLLSVVELTGEIKKKLPQTLIVLGGPHPTLYPQESLNLEGVDYVVTGEGEVPFAQLLNYLENPSQIETAIPGVLGRQEPFNRDTQIFINQDLDQLPIPARDLTPYEKYRSVVSKHPPSTTIMGSRGCPYNCTFCWTAGGKKFRPRSVPNLLEEIENCLKMGIKEFFFFDENFALDRERVVDFCNQLKKSKMKIYWDVRARIDHVDPELLKLMKSANCQRIQYGVESGSDRVLKRLKKGFTTDQARKAIQWTKEAGISTYSDFMIGNPGETMEDVEMTFRFAKALDPDYVHYSITMPLPRTPLYRQALQDGIIREDYWREFAKKPRSGFRVKYWEEHFDSSRLEELVRRGYREFYFRPRYLAGSIKNLKSPGEFMRKVSAGLKLFRDF